MTLASRESIQRIFDDIHQWPDSWRGDEHDLVPGNLMLGVFIEYLVHLVDKGRARSTVRKHGDYLWALGGEIIRDINHSGFNKRICANDLLLKYIDSQGGPYWRYANSEEDQRQYDSVCRSLYKFLNKPARV